MITFKLTFSASLLIAGLASMADSDMESEYMKPGFHDVAESQNFFEQSGINKEEFLAKIKSPLHPDGGVDRRRSWREGRGPGSDWTVDPNPYHFWWSRPDVRQMRWYMWGEDGEWDKDSSTRGADETWGNWRDAVDSKEFDPKVPTVFVIVGFMNDPKAYGETIKLFLERYADGVNIILVETHDGMFANLANGRLGGIWSFPFYLDAAHNTQDVGYQTAGIYASLLNAHGDTDSSAHPMLHQNGESWNVQCIGGSLGAQACGRFGRTVDALTDVPVNRITALDAAGPAFQEGQPMAFYSVNKDDGYFVEAVHTNGRFARRPSFIQGVMEGFYGLDKPYGDADFYVNGGQYQPGCMMLGCSHGRMLELWEVTAVEGNEFKTEECRSWEECSCYNGSCREKASTRTPSDVTMGQFGTQDAKGLFFVPTSGNSRRGFKFNDELYIHPDGRLDQGSN